MVPWFTLAWIRTMLLALLMTIALSEAGAVSEPVLPVQTGPTGGAGSGYRKFEQLQPIHAALAGERFQDALDAATTIIETPGERFPTAKQARVIKAYAYLLRSDARLGQHEDNELVLRDEPEAAARGLRRAAYRAGARLAILHPSGPRPRLRGLRYSRMQKTTIGLRLSWGTRPPWISCP